MQQWVKWILGIAATVITAGVLSSGAKLAEHGERIAKTEVQFEHLQKGQERIEKGQREQGKQLNRLVEGLLRGR